MRLATRALIAALATLVLCAVVSAQTVRSNEDPRNQAPTVGTGGPEGGPTGLFTIYDGATIRRGEFTFSIAYSNYDRDPGNVDIADIPLSFNVGLNDHIELFFKTNGYRGIKVNTPTESVELLPSELAACLRCWVALHGPSDNSAAGSRDWTAQDSRTVSPLFRPAGPPCNTGGQPFRDSFRSLAPLVRTFNVGPPIAGSPFTSVLGAPFGGRWKFWRRVKLPGNRFSGG